MGKKAGKSKKGDKKNKKGKGKKISVVLPPVEVKPEKQPEVKKSEPLTKPKRMVGIKSLTGDYRTLLRLLTLAFAVADRVCMDTPWGTYIIFRTKMFGHFAYYLFDGCVCNAIRFRYINSNDVRSEFTSDFTSDFTLFPSKHAILKYVVNAKAHKGHCVFKTKNTTEQICCGNLKNI